MKVSRIKGVSREWGNEEVWSAVEVHTGCHTGETIQNYRFDDTTKFELSRVEAVQQCKEPLQQLSFSLK